MKHPKCSLLVLTAAVAASVGTGVASAQSPKPPAPSTAPAAKADTSPQPAASAAIPASVAPAVAAATQAAASATAAAAKATPTGAAATAAGAKPPAAAASSAPAAAPAVPVAAAPQVIVVQAPAAAPSASGAVEPTANNWITGLIGMGILAAGAYFGIRAAKARGITVEGALKHLGVETPETLPSSASFAQMKPAPTPMPPLPALSDLPLAGPASSAGASATAVATRTTVALVGVGGSVAGERFDLQNASTPFTIGRDDANSLALTADTLISRRHAEVIRDGSRWLLGDLGSSNGTFLNGSKVSDKQPLRPGDEIQVGGSRFRFEG